MRAIDADALQKQLTKKKPGPANARYTEGFNDALLRFKSMIHSADTIEPRKKGKWIDDEGNTVTDKYCAICSACGEWSEYLTAYCPNCGAKMREPEDIPMEYFESGGR